VKETYKKIYIIHYTQLNRLSLKMGITSRENSVGAWAFLIGVILAVVIGASASSFLDIPSITQYSDTIFGILVILGLVVGFMMTGKDSEKFMIAGAVIVIVSNQGGEAISGSLIGLGIIDAINSVFAALVALFVPATIIVALKSVFNMAKV
jgi:hypothetical protein